MINKKGIIAIFVIILFTLSIFIILRLLIFGIFGGPKVFIGTVTKTIPNDYTDLELSIDHIYGSASIAMAPEDTDYLLLIEVDEFRESGTTLSEEYALEYTEINNETISVIFDDSVMAAADPGPGWNNIRFFIRENITLSLDIIRGCHGGFNITLHNLTITHLGLNYDWSKIEHIASFTNVLFNSSDPLILRSVTASRFELNSNRFVSNLTIWYIRLGRFDSQTILDLIQMTHMNNSPSLHQFYIDCRQQSIIVNLRMNTIFGINITVNTDNGLILLPNNLTDYVSSDYDLSEVKYEFIVISTNGDITFNLFDS